MNQPRKRPSVYVFTTAYHPFIGGAEIAIEQIAKRLQSEFDFFIVTARMDRTLLRREVRPEGTVIRLGMGNWFDKFLLPFLSLLSIRSKPDILFGLDISTGALAAAALKTLFPKKRFIFNIQYGYGDERLQRGRFGLLNLAFRYMLSRADFVTPISGYLLRTARKYGYTGDAEVIPNGVSVVEFKRTRAREGPRSENANVVITTSRLVYKNGIDVLIGAIAEAKKEIPDISCHIIGDGEERTQLENLSRKLGVANQVKFFGNIPYGDLPRYFENADIFARPSRSEGLGISFLDALAAGVPIIGTAVGGIPDIIQDGETGLFVGVEDHKDLAEKIKLLLRDASLRKKIGANGMKLVEEKFTWDRIGKKYTACLLGLLQAKQRVLIATGIYPPDIGGPATYSKLLFEELPQRGMPVEVLSFGEVRRYPPGIRHILYFLKALWRARRADIIFAQDPVSVGFPASIAAGILRKKFLLKIVGDFAWEQGTQRFGVSEVLDEFLQRKYNWRVELLRKVQRWSAKRAHKVIVPSEYLKRVVSKWGIDSKKITVVYHAIDFAEIKTTKEEARTGLGVSGKVLVSAGRLVPWKGFDALIDMMPKLIKEFPDLKLVIVGDGPDRTSLESRITNYGLSDRVLLTGALPKATLLKYLRASDIFLLNTSYEGFSHQIPEAMAAGIPVITTRVGGNPEAITDGTDGFLVPFNDQRAFQEKISLLFRFPESYDRIVERGVPRAKTFGRARMIDGVTAILKTL